MIKKHVTYRAYYTATGRGIYDHEYRGSLIGSLPLGTMPCSSGQCGTLDRRDGGDPFECAYFMSDGRTVAVERNR